MRAVLGAGMLLVLAGCAGRGSVFTGRTGADAVAGLHARGAARGANPDAVSAALGPAVRVTRDTIANRHGAGIDTVVTVVQEGGPPAAYGRLLALMFGGLAARTAEGALRREVRDLAAAAARRTTGPPVAQRPGAAA